MRPTHWAHRNHIRQRSCPFLGELQSVGWSRWSQRFGDVMIYKLIQTAEFRLIMTYSCHCCQSPVAMVYNGFNIHGLCWLMLTDVDRFNILIYSTWVCLKIGYIPNHSHLIGIMISNHWVFRGTLFSDKPTCCYLISIPHCLNRCFCEASGNPAPLTRLFTICWSHSNSFLMSRQQMQVWLNILKRQHGCVWK